jgi:hypothetical protein
MGAVTVAPAFPDIIYSNFGPDDSYNSRSGEVLLPYRSIITSFTPSADFTFVDIKLALRSNDLLGFADVYLEGPGILRYLDQEGPILDSPRVVAFSCFLCPTLTSGSTYWIVAKSDTTAIRWFSNDIGDSTSYWDQYESEPWNEIAGRPRPVFAVDGALTTATASVPEPASAFLLVVGFAFALRRRKPPLPGTFNRRSANGQPCDAS